MDGLAADESDNDYSYFSRGPDGRSGTGDDLLGRFSIRRYNWENWSVDTFGKVLNWQNHQTQDAVAAHILRNLFTRYRLAFPGETYTQTYQRLAAWWKLPSRANDIHPRQTWSIGLKSYVYKVGQKTNNLGYDGWGHEGHLS